MLLATPANFSPIAAGLKLSELIGSLSHALDITEGQPEGHCVRCCWIGMHIGREIGLDDRQLWELYYTLLLKDLGCSSNAARICELYLTDDLQFKRGYDKRLAYAQSKLACLMFAYELQRRLTRAGHTTLSVAAHPGVSSTNLFQHMPKIVNMFAPLTALVLQSAQGGAQPTLYAALGDDIQGGDYCGPQSLGEMRGDPVKVDSSRRSRDEAVAAKLWAVSEELTGVRFLD